MSDLHLMRALLCLSGFAGQGIFIEGFEDPADLYCEIAKSLGLEDMEDDDLREAIRLEKPASVAIAPEVEEALHWIALFADVRSQDDSKTFAKVNRGALRTIRDKARAAIAKALPPVPGGSEGL